MILPSSLGRREDLLQDEPFVDRTDLLKFVLMLPSVSLPKKQYYKLNRVTGAAVARIKTLPRLGHSGHCCVFLLRREGEQPSPCPWGMR